MELEKSCRVCEKPFIARSNNACYCVDCRRKVEKERDRRKRRELKAYQCEQKRQPKPKESIGAVASKALAAGMTYGQYVSRYEGAI